MRQKFGVAVIGASMRSVMLLDYLRRHPDEGFVAGVYDVIGSRSECLIAEFAVDGAVTYESLDQAVSDPRAEAVFVSTPDHAHREPVVAALNANKHVYSEKPLAITLADCDAIFQAAQTARTVFYLGMNLRHAPVYETLHEMVSEGRLGKVLTIEADEHYYGGRTYFRRWNRLRRYGGGLWVTKACHDFDLLNWFAGGAPVRVFATSNLSHYKPVPGAGTHCRACRITDQCPDYYDVDALTGVGIQGAGIEPAEDPQHQEPAEGLTESLVDRLASLAEQATGQPRDLCLYTSDKDTFDNGMAVVEYDNDTRAVYTVNVVTARETRKMLLTGTEGSAEGDLSEGSITYWERHTRQTRSYDLHQQTHSVHGGADDRILEDFFRCCRTGRKPRSSWLEGRLSVQLGLAARRSADTGMPVDVDQ